MISGKITQRGGLSGALTAGVGGTSDYTELENKPLINSVELIGNKNAHDLDLASVQDVATLTGQLSDLASDVALMGQKLPKNYSTDEQNTGVKWIDGKYIYQKTLYYNESSDIQSKVYDISFLNIDSIIDEKSIVKLGSAGGNAYFTTPLYENPSYNMGVAVKNNRINVWSNGWYFSEVRVTLYYTKNEV